MFASTGSGDRAALRRSRTDACREQRSGRSHRPRSRLKRRLVLRCPTGDAGAWLSILGRQYVAEVLPLLLVAASIGMDNFGAATAIGVAGVDRGLRLRVALIFGVFEAAMPLVGLLLGRSLAQDLGSAANPVGGVLLGLAGVYAIGSEAFGKSEVPGDTTPGTRRLVLLGAALSIDNLVIGFALGTFHVNLLMAAITIAVVSVALSLLGLEIGSRLGRLLGQRSQVLGGAVLILVGVLVGTGLM